MANKTKTMQKLRLILKLLADGQSQRQVARATKISRTTIKAYHQRVLLVGLDLSKLSSYDDATLHGLLYQETLTATDLARYEALKARLPTMLKDITNTGVTRLLLWEEYSKVVSDPYGYTQFCEYFNKNQVAKNAVMCFEHKAGERVMIDFAGRKLRYIDRLTGEIIECDIFVGILPGTSYMFVKAVRSQRTEDFTDAISSMFTYFGGVPKNALIDNLKSGVTKPDRYEPKLNEVLEQLSGHYGTVFTATRPYKPRDKASVEGAVRISYLRIFARLRNQTFYSLEELNEAILEQLDRHHHLPFQRNEEQTRQSLFEQIEKPTLRPLPPTPFILKYTADYTVQFNYHIQLGCDRHFYSVPYQYIGQRLQVVYTSETVEIYSKNQRIAFHKRNRSKNGYTTTPEHRPKNHLHYLTIQGYDKTDFLSQAEKIGPNCVLVCEHLLNARQFQEQAFSSCLGLVRLAPKYTPARVEAACQRALKAVTPNYQCVKNILKNNLDLKEVDQPGTLSETPTDHENLRGAEAFF
jgi:transposase